MISQHLQAATLAVQVWQQYLKEGTALDAIDEKINNVQLPKIKKQG